MKRVFTSLMVGSLLVAPIVASHAASVTFAQFQQDASIAATGAGNQFKWTGASSGTTGVLGLVGSFVSINFEFLSPVHGYLGALGAYTTGDVIKARLNILSAKSTSGNVGGTQAIDSLTFEIDRTSDGLKLLAGTAGSDTGGGSSPGGQLTAVVGQQSATLNGSSPDNVNPQFVDFTSNAVDLTGILNQNYAFGFSSVTPVLSTFGVFPFATKSFTAAGVGTFAANFNVIPEPGTTALMVGMLVGGGALRLRRRRK